MTDLEKLEIACTANDGRFREMSVNKAYLMARLVDYQVDFWNKDITKFGHAICEDYETAKKTAYKLSQQKYWGKIHAYQKNSSICLAYNLLSFGNWR